MATPLHNHISLGNRRMSKSINISFQVELHETVELYLKNAKTNKDTLAAAVTTTITTTISLYM